MFGRTRLYRTARSPLIHGVSVRRRRMVWPWIVTALVLVAAAVLVWWVYLR